MVCVPDLMSAYQNGMLDLEGVQAVQLAMIAHCEQMGDRVAILDAPPGLNAQQVKEWRVDKVGYDSKYAALYWPWVKVFDPSTGTNSHVPPSGHMAGIWGRNDDTRGVHKAPANEVVRGAISLEINITKNEHDLLNPVRHQLHPLLPRAGHPGLGRPHPVVGRVVALPERPPAVQLPRGVHPHRGPTGSSSSPTTTPCGPRSAGPSPPSWSTSGARVPCSGMTPDEAFYVKCDGETNPAEGIDAGQVVCEIGVAPVKPAEFVIFRLSQFSGGTSLVNE